jgi:hypothetical protein
MVFWDLVDTNKHFEGIYCCHLLVSVTYIIIHCPSARCAYAANMVGKDPDIFSIRALSLNHIYTHQPKIVNIICAQSWCSVLCNS